MSSHPPFSDSFPWDTMSQPLSESLLGPTGDGSSAPIYSVPMAMSASSQGFDETGFCSLSPQTPTPPQPALMPPPPTPPYLPHFPSADSSVFRQQNKAGKNNSGFRNANAGGGGAWRPNRGSQQTLENKRLSAENGELRENIGWIRCELSRLHDDLAGQMSVVVSPLVAEVRSLTASVGEFRYSVDALRQDVEAMRAKCRADESQRQEESKRAAQLEQCLSRVEEKLTELSAANKKAAAVVGGGGGGGGGVGGGGGHSSGAFFLPPPPDFDASITRTTRRTPRSQRSEVDCVSPIGEPRFNSTALSEADGNFAFGGALKGLCTSAFAARNLYDPFRTRLEDEGEYISFNRTTPRKTYSKTPSKSQIRKLLPDVNLMSLFEENDSDDSSE